MRFRDDFSFLSNFYDHEMCVNGIVVPTLEHAFQMCKTADPDQMLAIANAPTPGEAKRMGRQVTLLPKWDGIRVGIMQDLLRKKFQDPSLRQLLLDTGDLELVEGNDWGDRFWGRVDGEGENQLGKLLMQVRKESRL